MKRRTRIKYTKEQKEEMWDRWQKANLSGLLDEYLIDRPHPSLAS